MTTSTKIFASFFGLAAFASLGLAQQTVNTVQGSAHGAFAGYSVAGVGDINLDGSEDFCVGIPFYDSGGVNRGQIKIISGATGTTLRTISGSSAGDEFGYSVSAVGDTNGDGVPEVLAGAPYASPSGSSSGLVRLINGATGATLLTVNGASAGDRFGFSVAYGGAAFLGPRRFVVGAPYRNNGGTDRGSAYSYLEDGTLIHEFTGTQDSEHFGWSVSGGMDASGDLTPDIVVGSPDYDDNGSDTGRAKLLNGSTFATIQTVPGAGPGHEFGYSVSLIGDQTGDSRADFIVGAPGFVSDQGAAYVHASSSGAILATKLGAAIGDRFGTVVIGAEDMNSDGRHDYLVGAPSATTGGAVGTITLYSGTTGSVLKLFNGPSSIGSDSGFGRAIAVADVNNSGRNDVIAGAYSATVNSVNDVGRVYVYSGSGYGQLLTFDGIAYGSGLGTSVTGLGDVNGDGKSDYVIGSPDYDRPTFLFPATIYSDRAGFARCYSGATGATLWTVYGAEGDNLGYSVARIKDINGDSVDDLAVGAPQTDVGSTGLGYVKILSGVNGATLFTINGSGLDDEFGAAVADAGDVNGNGVTDIIVGVPGFDSDRGRAVFVSGSSGAILNSFNGLVAGERFGSAVDGLGDITGDGRSDLLVGAPSNDTVATNAGRVYGINQTGNVVLFTLSGINANDEFGASVAALSDYTSDGKREFAVGSPGADYPGLTNCGFVRTYFSSPVLEYWTYYGAANNEGLGARTVNLGDTTGDGWADLASSGSELTIIGSGAGIVRILSGYGGFDCYILDGTTPVDFFGGALGAAGDVDGDTIPDIVVGAPFADGAAESTGEATVISLSPIGITRYGSSTAGCNGTHMLKANGAARPGHYLLMASNKTEPYQLGATFITDVPDYVGNDVFGIGVNLYLDLVLATEFLSLDAYGLYNGSNFSAAVVPVNPLLTGKHYYAQTINAWTTCSLPPLNLSATDALDIVIQP